MLLRAWYEAGRRSKKKGEDQGRRKRKGKGKETGAGRWFPHQKSAEDEKQPRAIIPLPCNTNASADAQPRNGPRDKEKKKKENNTSFISRPLRALFPRAAGVSSRREDRGNNKKNKGSVNDPNHATNHHCPTSPTDILLHRARGANPRTGLVSPDIEHGRHHQSDGCSTSGGRWEVCGDGWVMMDMGCRRGRDGTTADPPRKRKGQGQRLIEVHGGGGRTAWDENRSQAQAPGQGWRLGQSMSRNQGLGGAASLAAQMAWDGRRQHQQLRGPQTPMLRPMVVRDRYPSRGKVQQPRELLRNMMPLAGSMSRPMRRVAGGWAPGSSPNPPVAPIPNPPVPTDSEVESGKEPAEQQQTDETEAMRKEKEPVTNNHQSDQQPASFPARSPDPDLPFLLHTLLRTTTATLSVALRTFAGTVAAAITHPRTCSAIAKAIAAALEGLAGGLRGATWVCVVGGKAIRMWGLRGVGDDPQEVGSEGQGQDGNKQGPELQASPIDVCQEAQANRCQDQEQEDRERKRYGQVLQQHANLGSHLWTAILTVIVSGAGLACLATEMGRALFIAAQVLAGSWVMCVFMVSAGVGLLVVYS